MANQLFIPILNPLSFKAVTPTVNARYNTKFFDDYLFSETIFDFQEKKEFYQPAQFNDTFKLQFTSNFAPLQLQLQDCRGSVFSTVNASQIRANKYEPGSFLYEASVPLNVLTEVGPYRVILTPGGDTANAQKSEWFWVSDLSEHSILIEYSNNRFHGDVIFETGIVFSLRIPGFIENVAPGSSDVLYQDQVLDQTQLSSKPFRNWTLWVGDGSGVPPFLIDKINYAASCSNFSLDGKLFAKASDGKFSEFPQEGSPLKGYSLGMREGINRSSKIIAPALDPNKKITFVNQIASDLFGSVDSQGGNITIPVTSLG